MQVVLALLETSIATLTVGIKIIVGFSLGVGILSTLAICLTIYVEDMRFSRFELLLKSYGALITTLAWKWTNLLVVMSVICTCTA